MVKVTKPGMKVYAVSHTPKRKQSSVVPGVYKEWKFANAQMKQGARVKSFWSRDEATQWIEDGGLNPKERAAAGLPPMPGASVSYKQWAASCGISDSSAKPEVKKETAAYPRRHANGVKKCPTCYRIFRDSWALNAHAARKKQCTEAERTKNVANNAAAAAAVEVAKQLKQQSK
eukprot:TRINITY_DN16937_c0_g1_i1.p2 TRINITY_DN16937_c0_g1~~TRINITY_DN16937_c0_g1_i1.p2  ORF type:complete len:184 (-),score=35.37 TRINITY_DN16937_c0_g1_i1:92-613(-)